MEWFWIVAIAVGATAVLLALSVLLYKQFFKRFYDIVISGLALIILSPLLIILTAVGAVAMGGNPFFTQERPGKIDKKTGREKTFKMIKFRSMSNKKDKNGNLLPDEVRLNKYGRILRATSLDELPELICIFLGQMSIVGPRPLLVQYLPLYSEEQRHRHDVRPGLTGYAQASGRNLLSWKEKFELDVYYVRNISLMLDIKIMFMTVKSVLCHTGINNGAGNIMEGFNGNN